MHILITRPEDVAISLANRLENLGHQVIIDPLITIIPTNPKLPPLSSFQSVVTTSQQAIRCLSNLTHQRDFPLWCVGKESAKIAKNLGFQDLHIADGSAERLISALWKDISRDSFVKPLPILHVSGDIIRVDLVKALQAKGISAQRIILYQTQEAANLSPETHQAMRNRTLDAVLFYSPRTAHVFEKLCRAAQLEDTCANLTAVCLSESIAQEIHHLSWKAIRVAKQTTTEDLLNELSEER